jgi:hypothetical protein
MDDSTHLDKKRGDSETAGSINAEPGAHDPSLGAERLQKMKHISHLISDVSCLNLREIYI